jgi:hypothetical protein
MQAALLGKTDSLGHGRTPARFHLHSKTRQQPIYEMKVFVVEFVVKEKRTVIDKISQTE